MPVAGVRVAVRQVGRADPALPKAHRSQALQVRRLREVLCPERPPRSPHEATPAQAAAPQVIKLMNDDKPITLILLTYLYR